MTLFPAEIIKKKRNGDALTREELEFFVNEYVADRLPDYQMSALLMAIYFQSMTPEETSSLTDIMKRSGLTLDFSHLAKPIVDKHSTGGVGDKTSLILAPIVAAAGLPIPMIAGRGLGHTGGTLDKLEAIPGFSVQITIDQFKKQVEEIGVSIIGQTEQICPADKRIYALRDVTGTVESLPLICASIMSKKLAEGLTSLVLDVKFGSGAFMKSRQQAQALAEGLMAIGKHSGKNVVSILSSMEQPLGFYAGNALEVLECVQLLKGEDHELFKLSDGKDTMELSLLLAAWMFVITGHAKDEAEGIAQAKEIVTSGKAFAKFQELILRQGGDLSKMKLPTVSCAVSSTASGYLQKFECEQIGLAGIALGAGRLQKSDVIDPLAGIAFHKKIGDEIKVGETLFTLFGQNDAKFSQAKDMLSKCYTVGTAAPKPHQLVWKVLK